MPPQRAWMLEHMIPAGFARGAQKHYLQAARRPTAHYHRSPDLLREGAGRSYLLDLHRRRMARGTCRNNRYDLQFFYR
jgi:hypothetical protein